MSDQKTYQTIDEYIEDQPKAVQNALNVLRECILKAAPDASETFNYNIPAFTLVEGGKRDQQIMMAGYPNHVGLYPHPTTMENFSADLSDYKTGKGSVQFPLDQPIPKALVVKMVKYRLQMLTSQS
jgi:uncharacterized protein YdhG (YjbR/CyaY superfamily)